MLLFALLSKTNRHTMPLPPNVITVATRRNVGTSGGLTVNVGVGITVALPEPLTVSQTYTATGS